MTFIDKAQTMVRVVAILLYFPWITGFVLLSKNKATLEISPDAPSKQFVWDGKAPRIKDKEKYKSGEFQDLSDEEFMEKLLQDAMDIWNRVPGSFVVIQASRSTSELKTDPKDGIFAIITDSSSNSTTAAYAKPQPKEDNSSIIGDCDISISDRETAANDLVYTIAHELGHCLGLGHDHTNYGALMGYSRLNRSLSLGADDIAGVTFLYPDPTHGSAPPKELICGTVGGRPETTEKGFFLVLLPLVILLGAIVTRRILTPMVHAAWSMRRTYSKGDRDLTTSPREVPQNPS